MVRASDCGPEGRRFDPDIPPHTKYPVECIELGTVASQGAIGSIPISHPIKVFLLAGVVQRLVCKFSKLEIGFRLPSPAPIEKGTFKCFFCGNML